MLELFFLGRTVLIFSDFPLKSLANDSIAEECPRTILCVSFILPTSYKRIGWAITTENSRLHAADGGLSRGATPKLHLSYWIKCLMQDEIAFWKISQECQGKIVRFGDKLTLTESGTSIFHNIQDLVCKIATA